MKTEVKKINDTERAVTITADKNRLEPIAKQVYDRLRPQVKAAGFRPGKAPDKVLEKELGINYLQQEVMQEALNQLYVETVKSEKLEPLEAPKIDLKKYVPYSELEFTAHLEVMPEVKLPDYKKIKKSHKNVEVTEEEIDKVIKTVQERLAEKKEVKRAAKSGDEATIDFKGTKDGKAIPNADGRDYPLKLGGGQFIPGFEEEIVGLKPGEEKDFKIKFPKYYPEQSLAGQEVEFKVSVKKVSELALPKVDDELAKKAGPFKNMNELKESITKSIENEKTQQQNRELENEIVNEVVGESKLPLPSGLVAKQLDNLLARKEQDLMYRGKTLDDYLKEEGKKREELEKELHPEAEKRVKTALVLTKIAEKENLEVKPEELEIRLQILKGQYRDKETQIELEKPEVRREIANQMLTEKVVQQLVDYTKEALDSKAKNSDKKSPAVDKSKKSNKKSK